MSTIATRRDLLTGAVATGVASIVPLAAAASAVADPVLVIAAERDRLKAIRDAAEERFEVIRTANPGPMGGCGWPVADRSLAIFRRTNFRDGEDIPRWHIEGLSLIMPDDKAALLKWWDDTYAKMQRRAIVTGYRQACNDVEAACDAYGDKECEMADVQATTVHGALVKLEAALDVIVSEEPSAYEDMALGALADLKRLTR